MMIHPSVLIVFAAVVAFWLYIEVRRWLWRRRCRRERMEWAKMTPTPGLPRNLNQLWEQREKDAIAQFADRHAPGALGQDSYRPPLYGYFRYRPHGDGYMIYWMPNPTMEMDSQAQQMHNMRHYPDFKVTEYVPGIVTMTIEPGHRRQ